MEAFGKRTYGESPLVELMLVVFALFALATPFATVYLLWRQHKIRQQLLKLTDLSMEVTDGLRRDLLELKRQLDALPKTIHAGASTPTTATQPARAASLVTLPVTKPVETAAPKVATPLIHAVPPVVVTPPATATPPSPSAVQHSEIATQKESHVAATPPKAEQPIASKPAEPAEPIPPSKTEENTSWKSVADFVDQKAEAILKPSSALESQSAAEKTAAQPPHAQKPETAKPPIPVTPPPVSPRQVTAGKSPVNPPVVPTHPAAVPPPPPPSARTVASSQTAAFRAPLSHAATPRKTVLQSLKSLFAFEESIGAILGKIGITLVVFGVAYFGILGFGRLEPAGKVGVLYAVAIGLLAGGIFLEKRERYHIYGHTLIGGGWALLFFTTYALNHVEAMRVMSSETGDLILMLAVAIGMVVHTLRYRSQLVTGLAFLLAYGTVALSHDDVYSLSSGIILALGLVAIVIRMGWFELEVFGIIASYFNHAYWLYRLLGPQGANGHAFPDYHASTAILLFYWITYRISYVIRKTTSARSEHISTAAALLNTLLLLGVMKFQSVQPELAFVALLVIGAVEFSLGQLSMTKRRREAFVVLSVMGAALMIAAFPFRYSGNNLDILWMVGAEVFLIAGVMVGEVVFRRLGMFAGLLVGLHLCVIDLRDFTVFRSAHNDIDLHAGLTFALCGMVFYLNSLYVSQRWKAFFSSSLDEGLLVAHSYIGAFSAVFAGWALSSGDWTAVIFACIMLALAALGHRLKSHHLQLQFGVIGLLSLYCVAKVNLHNEVAQYTHVTNRLITLPMIAAAFYLTAKWAVSSDAPSQKTFRGILAFVGTGLLTLLIYFEVPELWQPCAAIVFAVALLEIGQQINYKTLIWHTHLLTALSVVASLAADQSNQGTWHTIPLHAISALPVVIGAYWVARRINLPNAAHINLGRSAYSWAGTGLMAWVLYQAMPAPWISVSWIVFAVLLALVMRRINYRQLGWQANAVAAAAVVRAYTFDLETNQPLWSGISLRLVVIAIIAAGLYVLSRKSTDSETDVDRVVAYLHTTAATALLALLAWHEEPNGWLVAIWAMFALVLTIVDRRFQLEDLRWQAHALAAITMVRSIAFNIYLTDTWRGISVRLLSLSLVAVVFYAMALVIRIPDEYRKKDFHHIYSWAASALVSLLAWYELNSLSVAVGWAVFGLVLFEYGLWRRERQFRFQSYVALAASFGRIFFANLTAGNPDEFWGPRVYTVLPIALILFFVYAQLGPGNTDARDDHRLRFDLLLAYLGTGTIVVLLYFQFANEWLVTAWAEVVFALFAVSLLLDRPIFLHQALLLTLGTCARGVMHNLFGASYFTAGDWTGRFFVLGSAIVAMLACLPFAYRWRDRSQGQSSKNWIVSIAQHPEQVMFFAPVALLTLMLAVKMRSGMITVSWGIESLLILIFAFLINERSFRLTGLLLLLLSFGKILVVDMWGLETRDRYITLIIVGAAMSLASFFYAKYREKIRQFL